MTRKVIIMDRSIRKDGVNSNKFIMTRDIGASEARIVITMHRKTPFSLVPLCGVTKSVTAAVNGCPAKQAT